MRSTATVAFFFSASMFAWAQKGDYGGQEGSLKTGDAAPDVAATLLGTKERFELKKVLEKEKKPVVLIFGSYT